MEWHRAPPVAPAPGGVKAEDIEYPIVERGAAICITQERPIFLAH